MPAQMPVAIVLILAALAMSAATSDQGVCKEDSKESPKQKQGLGLFQFSRSSDRLSAAPAEGEKEEGKDAKKEADGKEAKKEADVKEAEKEADGKEAKKEADGKEVEAEADSANSTSAANATDAANTTKAAAAPTAMSVAGCVTRSDPRVGGLPLLDATPSPEGTPCVFGADARDEGSHCIFDDGVYGSNGWCYTSAEKETWGSCNELCPLYGPEAQLGKKIDTVAKVVKKVKAMLKPGDEEEANEEAEEQIKEEAKEEVKA